MELIVNKLRLVNAILLTTLLFVQTNLCGESTLVNLSGTGVKSTQPSINIKTTDFLPVEKFFATKFFLKPEALSNLNITDSAPKKGHFKISALRNTAIFELLKDDYKMAKSKVLNVKMFPIIEFDFVVYKNFVIPKQRVVQRNQHPGWEWQISPGTGWSEKDNLGYASIVFPFSLQEKNANCTHNGLLKLDVNASGDTRNGIFQIASETCAYFQFDWVGKVAVEYSKLTEGSKVNRNYLVNLFDKELESQSKFYALSELKKDFPKLNIQKLLPKPLSSSTTSGIVIKGKHYSLNCSTRHGVYPYCNWLALPS